jgi:hypothetical protein
MGLKMILRTIESDRMHIRFLDFCTRSMYTNRAALNMQSSAMRSLFEIVPQRCANTNTIRTG